MKELIKIVKNNNDTDTVSARELYLGLGLYESNWSRWSKINIEDNKYFKENIDWEGFFFKKSGNETKDFEITIEFAKHIVMMADTKNSHDYRNYFISVEKNYKSELLRIQDNAYRKIGELGMEVQALNEKIPKPVLIAKRKIDVIALFNYINELSGDGLLFDEMYYKIDKEKGSLSIDIRKTYKVLRENYKDVEMFQSQPIAIESAIDKHNFCFGTHFVTKLMNDKYEMKPTHVAIIDINKLEEAGACIDNLY